MPTGDDLLPGLYLPSHRDAFNSVVRGIVVHLQCGPFATAIRDADEAAIENRKTDGHNS